MKPYARAGSLLAGTALAVAAAMGSGSAALAAHTARAHAGQARPALPRAARAAEPPLLVQANGRLPDSRAQPARAALPTGLGPQAIASVYSLSGLAPASGAGAGQVIAVVDAYRDPHALADLNTFDAEYGYPAVAACASLAQAGPCFLQASPAGRPAVDPGWALEQSLDIEWAHAEAPAAKIVLVEAANNRFPSLFGAVSYADGFGATEISMSWGGPEFPGERAYDALLANPGTLYVASSGDGGHGTQYPAASPDVIAVGGTTLAGCGGTSCAGFTHEKAWALSGGGVSRVEAAPPFQTGYTGPVHGDVTIAALTRGRRGIPDVSFDASPSTGVSVYDSTRYQGQAGWFTLGGTSVGAANWTGILAAGAAAGQTALQGRAAIYAGGYATGLRDITRGRNGACGPACRAGAGYDLVTGLGSPVNYP
jgi:subtilase family serine protease